MLPLYTYPHETSHAVSPWVKYGPYGLRGQKVKGQGHIARIARLGKMVSSVNCSPFTPIFMKLHMQSPHESSMDPMDFRVKRSRSQCKDYWKWFLAHNCFPFTPILMKLHMQSPHESSMGPLDFGVKRSKVKVTMQGLLKKDSGA